MCSVLAWLKHTFLIKGKWVFFFGLQTTLVFKTNLNKHPVFEGLPNYLTTHRMVKNMLSKGNMLKY